MVKTFDKVTVRSKPHIHVDQLPMKKSNFNRLHTEGIKLQKIGTQRSAKETKDEEEKQAYSHQLVNVVSNSASMKSMENEHSKNEDIFAMVAAVLAPHVVERVGKEALQDIADSHGASLVTGPNAVVMGPQHIVDKVKQELLTRAEKTDETPAEEDSPATSDDTAQNSTVHDGTADSVSQGALDKSRILQDPTSEKSISDDSTSQDRMPAVRRKKRRVMPSQKNPPKWRKVDSIKTELKTDEGESIDMPDFVKVADSNEAEFLESISIKSVSKNLERFELVEMENGATIELARVELEEAICEHCGYKAKSSTALYHHLKNFHDKKKQYKCDICFDIFGFASALRLHRSRHYESDNISLKSSAIIVHLQRREGKEVTLEEQDRGQIEKYEQDMALLKQKPIVRLAKVKGNQATGLVQENVVREIKIDTEKEPDEIICDQDAAPEKVLDLIKEKKTKSAKEFQCMLCKAILHSQMALNKHLNTLHVESTMSDNKRTMMRHRASTGQSPHAQQYQCPQCDFRCARMQNFTRHVKNHDNPDLYRCDECPYTNTRRAEVLRHKRNNHGEAKLECEYCHKMFRTQPILNTHVAARHTKKYADQCDSCGLVLSSKLALRKHKKRHHSSDALLEKTHITCNKCGRGFTRKKDFLDHVEEFHNNVSRDNTANENVVLEEDGSSFRCGVCQTYKNKSAREVRKHIERMHCPKDKACELCNKSFATDAMLAKHTQIEHLLEELSKCSFCDKMFKSKNKVRLHELRVHSGVKKFACEICNRQFLEKHQWKRHVEIHLPEDERSWRYACEVCGKRYRFKCNYDYHMLEHSDEPDAHKCQTCGRGFKTKHTLEAHMSTHSEHRPFVCTYCGRGFKLKKYLDCHLLAHATEKFVCKACGRLFVSKTHLERHLCKAVAIRAPLVSEEQQLLVIQGEDGGRQGEMWMGQGHLTDEDMMGQILHGGQLVLMNGEVVKIQGEMLQGEQQGEPGAHMVQQFQQVEDGKQGGVQIIAELQQGEGEILQIEDEGEVVQYVGEMPEGAEIKLEQGEGDVQVEQQEEEMQSEELGYGDIKLEQASGGEVLEQQGEMMEIQEGEGEILIEQPSEGVIQLEEQERVQIMREQGSENDIVPLESQTQLMRETDKDENGAEVMKNMQQTVEEEIKDGEILERVVQQEAGEQTVYFIISQ